MYEKKPLLTAGYATHQPDSFLELLKRHGVRLVIDVRQNPVSRRPGFSRSALARFLALGNIELRNGNG